MNKEKLYELALKYRQLCLFYKIYKKNNPKSSDLSKIVDILLEARDKLLDCITENI